MTTKRPTKQEVQKEMERILQDQLKRQFLRPIPEQQLIKPQNRETEEKWAGADTSTPGRQICD